MIRTAEQPSLVSFSEKGEDDAFEVFKGRTAGPPPRDLLVTFQRRGLLTFNRAAFEALGQPEAVELLFNRRRQILGVRPGNPDDEWTYKLRREERSKMFKISIAAFRRHYGLPDYAVAHRFRAELRDGILTVDLRQRPVVTGGDAAF